MRRAAISVALFVHATLAMSQQTTSPEQAEFRVGDIKVEGLQRVSEGTVYNYLPVNIGDTITPQRVREVRARAVPDGLLPRRAGAP